MSFEQAVYLIKNGPAQPDSSNEQKLKFYKFFKQANSGDNTASQPWAVQLEARAKWDAWDSVKGMSKEDAEAAYCKLLADANPSWADHEVLKAADAPK